MRIVDFKTEHIKWAKSVAQECYKREREAVPSLPEAEALPDLMEFAENNLGSVAYQDNEPIGFLCSCSPFDNAFGTTGIKGTFSPIHAHGVLGENRGYVYARLYEAAAKKWVNAGIASHSIGLYAHDNQAIDQLFKYGFGLRCIDAIRSTADTIPLISPEYKFSELSKTQTLDLYDMFISLVGHLENSPTFMKYSAKATPDSFASTVENQKARYFAASHNGKYIAHIKTSDEGENFATLDPSMINICGAYCLPEYRGKGVYQSLLSYLNETLKSEGCTRLGVDFESFNPTAWGFWLKHFTAYTYGVVRRIDDNSTK